MRSSKRTLFSSLGTGLLFVLASCGGGGSGNSGGSGDPAGGANLAGNSIYVLSGVATDVVQLSRTASGAAAPTAIIQGTPTASGFGTSFSGLAIDPAGNLFVGYTSGTPAANVTVQILEYPPGANGTAKPATTIATGLSQGPLCLEVDHAGNLYAGEWVTGIYMFSPANGGNFVQSKMIGGAATTISVPVQMAVDSANNLYVANQDAIGDAPDSVLIFNSAATGNVAPTNTIGGSKTLIDDIEGVALDGAGNIYVLSGLRAGTPPQVASVSIVEFSAGSTGNVAPMRTITGSSTNLSPPGGWGLRVDSTGNIYVSTNTSKILKFAPDATGNVAPIAEIDEMPLTLGDANWTTIALN
ncbi:hypothetical protein P8935_23695 [Telmatobacter sp. DSM 110680]|uniref:Uncharacterized protein n=1 Tax=Telmatobacter sp. DSM 110680 TaxID=3036704 RepID=A0AAU7DHJ2_9BACT